MRNALKKPWFAGLTSTLLVVVVSSALLLGDGADPGSEQLPALLPSGGEVAFSAGFVMLLFLVLWALFWLATRFGSPASRARG